MQKVMRHFFDVFLGQIFRKIMRNLSKEEMAKYNDETCKNIVDRLLNFNNRAWGKLFKGRREKGKFKRRLFEIVRLLVDRLSGCDSLTLISFTVNLPTLSEIKDKVSNYGWKMGPLDEYRFENMDLNNSVMTKLGINLNKHFNKQDIERASGGNIHHNLNALIWFREFGKTAFRKHYHCLFGINGRRNFYTGEYRDHPADRKSLLDEIGFCVMDAMGLADFEFNCIASNGERGFGGYVNFKGNYRYDRGLTTSRTITRNMTQDDVKWLSKKLIYGLKMETKKIPKKYKGVINERERQHGKSVLMFNGMSSKDIEEKKRRSVTKGKRKKSERIHRR